MNSELEARIYALEADLATVNAELSRIGQPCGQDALEHALLTRRQRRKLDTELSAARLELAQLRKRSQHRG